MARPSSSMVGLLSSCLFNNRDAYPTGRRSSPYCCVNWASSTGPLAPVYRTKVRSKSGIFETGLFASAPLSCSKACYWWGPHMNSTPFLFKTLEAGKSGHNCVKSRHSYQSLNLLNILGCREFQDWLNHFVIDQNSAIAKHMSQKMHPVRGDCRLSEINRKTHLLYPQNCVLQMF